MPPKSSIARKPKPIKDTIHKMMDNGYTIAEITLAVLEKCEELGVEPPSRAAIGRYKKRIDAINAKLNETREVAKAVVAGMDNGTPNDEIFQVIIKQVEALVFTITTGDAVFNPKELSDLSKAVKSLADSRMKSLDLEKEYEAKFKKSIANKVKSAGKKGRLSKAALSELERILGGKLS